MTEINPYESPTNVNDHNSPTSLFVRCVLILLVIHAVTASIAAISDGYQIELLGGGPILPALAKAQDIRQRLLALIEFGFQLAANIGFVIWVYRSNKNARALKAEAMQFSPGWSVGWFFIPFASLFMPYLVLKELWQASSPHYIKEWRRASVSPILGIWWAICVVSILLQYSPLPVLFGQKELTDSAGFGTVWLNALREFFWGRMIFDAVGVAASLMTVIVIVSITNLQKQRQAAVNELASTVD